MDENITISKQDFALKYVSRVLYDELEQRIAELEKELKTIEAIRKSLVFEVLDKPDLIMRIHDYQDVTQKLEGRIAELEQAQRWIPVGERLPEEGQDIYVLRKGGVITRWAHSKKVSLVAYSHWIPAEKLLPPEGE